MRGVARFITLEGIEGVGKSTQVARLSEALNLHGLANVVTREPGGTPLAETIRQIVLTASEEKLPAMAELLLMFAARAVHLANLIEPNLLAGRWVICDRFTDATYAYQGGGRALNAGPIRQLESMVQGMRRPDLTLLLDAPVQSALARAAARNAGSVPDRFERERGEFFERVRGAYHELAAAEPKRIVVVDATRPIAEVGEFIFEQIRARSWIS